MKYIDLKAINAGYEHAADKVLGSGWYIRGEMTQRFEEHYARFIGTKHCVGVANGLDALTLILRAYKESGALHEGDEVIVPANTYIATILAITENRLKPVLVEPDINTLQIDDMLIEQAITDRTRAIMIVHLYGRCAFTDRIGDICSRHSLLLIEDNAQAHGCTFRSSAMPEQPLRRTGSIGNAAAHSFYPTKNLGAMGDAGAVTTNDEELAGIIRSIANYGSKDHYAFDYIGRNSRLDELQAAILDEKLVHLEECNRRRKEIAAIYLNSISHPDIVLPECTRDNVYHIFPILSPRRDELKRFLLEHGVETMIHYPIPPHKQACYRNWNTLKLPITERIHAEELSLPCNQAMKKEEAGMIASLLNSF